MQGANLFHKPLCTKENVATTNKEWIALQRFNVQAFVPKLVERYDKSAFLKTLRIN